MDKLTLKNPNGKTFKLLTIKSLQVILFFPDFAQKEISARKGLNPPDLLYVCVSCF